MGEVLSRERKKAVKGTGPRPSEQSCQPYHGWRPSLTTGNAAKVVKD